MQWTVGASGDDTPRDGRAYAHGSITEALRAIWRALGEFVGLLGPWPDYAPTDERAVMLAAERRRGVLSERRTGFISGEWRS